MPPEIILVIALALGLGFLNGVHGSSNTVATMISSRAFRASTALAVAAVAEFIGPFLFGVAVARTIGDQIIRSDSVTLQVLVACLAATILWNLITWFFGIPSSPSHGLFGGLVGATLAGAGVGALKLGGLVKLLFALFVAPPAGFLIGFALTRLIYFLARDATPSVNEFFKRGQLLTALALTFSQSANDSQKTMGLIVLGLVIGGQLADFSVPLWVVAASAASLALGTLLGGWRLIRTIGGRFYKIRPVHSFASQLTSALVMLFASLAGWPVSTTQVASSALIGVGSSERLSKVRWGMAGRILTTWIVTIPTVGLIAAGVYWLIEKIIV